MSEKIRVLIVDDSPVMQEAICSILEQDAGIEVVGRAKDGQEGVEKTIKLKPDIITMDLKMPVMSGMEAIERIMEDNPTPIVVVSSLDVQVIIKALSIGAMDFVVVTREANEIAKELLEKVKIAYKVKPLRRMKIRPIAVSGKPEKRAVDSICKVVAIGASTGGPLALQVFLSKLPAGLKCGILIVQHISRGFIEDLVGWLKCSSALNIKVAKAGEVLLPGEVLFAPDDYHLKIDAYRKIILSADIKSSQHVPSIDVMMQSVAASFGEATIGVIMTGMGKDGVEGIRAIKKAGGMTLAQDEASSAVFGMNKAAIDENVIDRIASLEKIVDEVVAFCIC